VLQLVDTNNSAFKNFAVDLANTKLK